jgi:hypothetical protein
MLIPLNETKQRESSHEVTRRSVDLHYATTETVGRSVDLQQGDDGDAGRSVELQRATGEPREGVMTLSKRQ